MIKAIRVQFLKWRALRIKGKLERLGADWQSDDKEKYVERLDLENRLRETIERLKQIDPDFPGAK